MAQFTPHSSFYLTKENAELSLDREGFQKTGIIVNICRASLANLFLRCEMSTLAGSDP